MFTVDPTSTTTSRTDLRTQIGAGLWIVGTFQFFTLYLIVQSAWALPYSWWLNYISDLGAAGCGPILGHAAGALLTEQAWGAASGRPWRVMAMITGAAWVVVGFVPEDVNLMWHSIGALPIFILGNAALVTACRSRSTRDAPFVRRWRSSSASSV